MKKPKIILFGGSFDPIHNGHITVGRDVFKQLEADQLIFVPARQSPHKTALPVDGAHRIEMIRLAIAGDASFSVSDCELHRPAPSYTLQTIEFFRKQVGDARLYWLIGADQLTDFGKWYCVNDLLEACQVVVMYRAGYPRPTFDCLEGALTPRQIQNLADHVMETPLIPISSTDIRRGLSDGIVPENWLPEAVLDYIGRHHLYGCRD